MLIMQLILEHVRMDSTLNGSGVVSPENSEDGALPTVAEQKTSTKPAPVATPAVPTPLAPAPSAPALNQSAASAPKQTVPKPIVPPSTVPSAPAPSVPAPLPARSLPVPSPLPPATASAGRTAIAPTPMPLAPLAPLAPAPPTGMSPFAALSAVLVPSVQQPMLFQQQQQVAATANAAKRRRVDQARVQPTLAHPGAPQPPQGFPMLAVAGMNPAALLSGQQLAAAAAQAMQQQQHGTVVAGRRKKSQAQIDRRRERNRILARRTRLRKKFFFESLQKEVIDLQQENAMLKELVRQNLQPDQSKSILDECDAMEKMPPSVLEAIGENASDIDPKDFSLVKSIQNSQHAFVITDPSLQDNPIVFASDYFCTVTGYKREEILGRNCRFLQGTETSKDKVKQIEAAVKQGEDVSVTFINYMADGTPFWNKLFIAALRDAQNTIVNFIGVTVKVANPPPGDPEHGKTLAIDGDMDDEECGDDEDGPDPDED